MFFSLFSTINPECYLFRPDRWLTKTTADTARYSDATQTDRSSSDGTDQSRDGYPDTMSGPAGSADRSRSGGIAPLQSKVLFTLVLSTDKKKFMNSRLFIR